MARERLPRDFGRKKRGPLPFAIATIFLGLVIGLGGWTLSERQGASAQTWMGHYCISSVGLRTDVTAANTAMIGQIRSKRPLPEVGRDLNGRLDALVAKAAAARAHMTTVGKPGGGSGDQAQAAMDAHLAKVEAELRVLKAQSAGTAFGNAWVFQGEAKNANTRLKEIDQELAGGYMPLSKLDMYKELKTAGDKTPACVQMRTVNGAVRPAP